MDLIFTALQCSHKWIDFEILGENINHIPYTILEMQIKQSKLA